MSNLMAGFTAVVFLANDAAAHVSVGATYEISKEIKRDGKIVQFVYRNPHSFVHVEAPDAAAAEAVHRQAHGLAADELIPVQEGR